MQVMRGDVVDMEAFAYHTGTYSDNGAISNTNVLATIISMVSGAAPTTVDGTVIQSAVNTNSAAIFVGGDGSSASPRAYLNYILFDQDFNYLDAGFTQVSATSGTHVAVNSSKTVSEKGYLYVYVSNESNNSFDVFFDDLRITHTKGKIMQEDHYYPGGATISALSSSAPLSKPNKFRIQGKEFQNDFSLNVYDFHARMYDPWLVRTFQHDPHAEDYEEFSPYHWAGNNPILNIDPSGMDWYSYTDEDGNNSVFWREGDASTVDVDGVTYNNIGALYSHVGADGSLTNYHQNEIISFIDGGASYEDILSTEEGRAALEDAAYIGGLEIEFVPERDNAQINKEIVNFLKSWWGDGDPDVGPTAPPMIGPDRRGRGSGSNGIRRTKHTPNRHVTRKKYPHKSKYKKPSQYKKLEDRTMRSPDKTIKQSNGRVRYEKTFGREIGTGGQRKQVVIYDPKKGKVITSYPSN